MAEIIAFLKTLNTIRKAIDALVEMWIIHDIKNTSTEISTYEQKKSTILRQIIKAKKERDEDSIKHLVVVIDDLNRLRQSSAKQAAIT